MRRGPVLARLAAIVIVGAGLLTGSQALAAPALASVSVPHYTLGQRILDTAESRTGAPYAYGEMGPWAFDCSGLVAWAAARHGISVPHSTYAMLAGTAHLYRIPLSWVQRGDLLFFGSGHVEFATVWHDVSYGAHHSGTSVGWRGWWPGSYQPTMAMRFR